MPEGIITAYDPETNEGLIEMEDEVDDIPFRAEDVDDSRPGEAFQPTQPVTFDIDGTGDHARAINVRHVADRGYGG